MSETGLYSTVVENRLIETEQRKMKTTFPILRNIKTLVDQRSVDDRYSHAGQHTSSQLVNKSHLDKLITIRIIFATQSETSKNIKPRSIGEYAPADFRT